jgi:DNA-binding CsgD family transcriptional regulator
LFPPRIEGIRCPQAAAADTLRLCATERDAFLASMTISGKTYEQVGDCIGISKQAVEKWKAGIPHKRITAFCNATGTTLMRDFLDRERAYKVIQGRQRESDRIAQIASYSMEAA